MLEKKQILFFNSQSEKKRVNPQKIKCKPPNNRTVF